MVIEEFLKKLEVLSLEYDFSPLFYKLKPQDYLDSCYDRCIYPMRFQFYTLSYARTKEIDTWFPKKLFFEDIFMKYMN